MAQSIGETIDNMHALREERRELEEKIKKLNAAYEVAERELMELMDTQQTRISAGKKASVHIDEVVFPTAENWDDIYAYLKGSGKLYLLERRLSTAGFRELFERGESVPGVVPFKKRKVKLISI